MVKANGPCLNECLNATFLKQLKQQKVKNNIHSYIWNKCVSVFRVTEKLIVGLAPGQV